LNIIYSGVCEQKEGFSTAGLDGVVTGIRMMDWMEFREICVTESRHNSGIVVRNDEKLRENSSM
jgi:hypothetical protein